MDFLDWIKDLVGGGSPSAGPADFSSGTSIGAEPLGFNLAQYRPTQYPDPNLIDVPPGTPPYAGGTTPAGAGQGFLSGLFGGGSSAPSGRTTDELTPLNWLGLAMHSVGAAATGRKSQVSQILQDRIQAAQKDQELKLKQFESIPKAIEVLKFVRTYIPEEKHAEAIPEIQKFMTDTLGTNVLSPHIADFMSGSSTDLAEFEAKFDVVKDWPKQVKLQLMDEYAKDPVKTGKKISDRVLNVANRLVEAGQQVPEVYKNALDTEDRKKLDMRLGESALKKYDTAIRFGDMTSEAAYKAFPDLIHAPEELRIARGIDTKSVGEAKAKAQTEPKSSDQLYVNAAKKL